MVLLIALGGCTAPPMWTAAPGQGFGQPGVVYCDNPVLIPIVDHEYVWEMVVDVVDDYFPRLACEEPVRLVGDTLFEGRLETFPRGSPTMVEPWRRDSAHPYQRLENTLQSMRRRATVRVIPAQGGYWVDVAVFRELEDVARPEHATAGAATLRYDASLTRVENPLGEQEINDGWIPQGRDPALEQRMLATLQRRIAGLGIQTLPAVR